jgi:hypothetical protein
MVEVVCRFTASSRKLRYFLPDGLARIGTVQVCYYPGASDQAFSLLLARDTGGQSVAWLNNDVGF